MTAHQQGTAGESADVPDCAVVDRQLARIQASPRFANAPRLRQLLTYLVENSARGSLRNLQEFTIGMEVFGRGEQFDPQSDTIVRVTARRLRRFLADYYAHEGRADTLRMRIPTGHYRIEFSVKPSSSHVRDRVRRHWLRRGIPTAGVLSALLGALLVVVVWAPERDSSAAASPEVARRVMLGQELLHRRGPGDLEQAVAEFEQAIAHDARNIDALVGLAWTLRVLAHLEPDTYQTSIPRQYWALHRALGLDPDHPEANARMASWYWHAGDFASAILHMRRALQNGADSSLVLSMLAGEERAAGNLQRAVELQRLAANRPPFDAASVGNLARMLLEAGEFEEALDVFHQAEKFSPRLPEMRTTIAQTLILTGRLEEAEKTLQLIPPGAERQQILALARHAAGRGAESRRALQALASYPASWRNALMVAEVHAFRGEPGPAIDRIESAYEQIMMQQRHSPRSCHQIQLLLNSPFFKALAGQPRFIAWADKARAFVSASKGHLLTLAAMKGKAGLPLAMGEP